MTIVASCANGLATLFSHAKSPQCGISYAVRDWSTGMLGSSVSTKFHWRPKWTAHAGPGSPPATMDVARPPDSSPLWKRRAVVPWSVPVSGSIQAYAVAGARSAEHRREITVVSPARYPECGTPALGSLLL